MVTSWTSTFKGARWTRRGEVLAWPGAFDSGARVAGAEEGYLHFGPVVTRGQGTCPLPRSRPS